MALKEDQTSEQVHGDAVRVPLAFRDMIARLNTDYLPAIGARLIYQTERGVWRLVKLAKGDPLTIDEIKALARKLGAVSENETVVGA